MLTLYWQIGDAIRTRQQADGWGTKVVDRLAADLRAEFPGMTGLSRSNLNYMLAFATAWPAEAIFQQPAGKLGWGHLMLLLDKLDDAAARDWYAAAAAAGGWSRDVLRNQIMNRTRERFGAAPSNFARHLEPGDSELAQQLAKDPYVFDFLGLSAGVAERDLEQALMDRMVDTLRELGTGFAFVGRQVHFEVDRDDFYLDLLFFEIPQLRYVVVELKIGKFEPGYAGQLGFYVALVDDKLRNPDAHKPTVGLLMCSDRNETVVRYSLGATTSPVAGVAQDHAGGCSRPAPRLGAPTVVARPDRGGSPGLFRRMVLTGLVAHLADRAGQGDGPPVTAEGRGTRRPVRCVHWGCEARRVGPASGRGVVPSPRRGGPRPWPGSWAGPVRVPTGQARTEAAPRGRHRSGRI